MTTEVRGNVNYAATVITVPHIQKVENSDRLYTLRTNGITVVVDESWLPRVGSLALLFPAETQLSEQFARANNLFRETDLNADPTQSGYLEKNRRIRSLKLRGVVSSGLALPFPEALHAVGLGDNYLQPGDVFDHLNGVDICQKYVVPVKETAGLTKAEQKLKKAFKRVDSTFLPEHFDSEHYLRNESKIGDTETLIVTQKLHGTSVRLANTIVKRELTWRDRLAQKLGIKVQDHDYDLVAGSRRAIKDPNNPNQKHFYGEGNGDVWTQALKVWGDNIPKNHIVFGELVGYVPGTQTPIQKGHVYECEPGEFQLYVYRVAIITENGSMIDLTWDQVRDFCQKQGLAHVPELDRLPKSLFEVSEFDELDFWSFDQKYRATTGHDLYIDPPVRISNGGTGKDEGIAIRVERGLDVDIYKFKFDSHYLFETAELDSGEADLESAG